MMVLPADHVITAPQRLRDSLAAAAAAATETGALVTLGITPTHPETGYGQRRWPSTGREAEAHHDEREQHA